MLKEEGVSAFWKGHAAGQLLSISYGAVQFGMYPVALSAITVRSGWAEPFHVCGGGRVTRNIDAVFAEERGISGVCCSWL